MEIQICPICGTPVRSNRRYPRYVCESCAERAMSADGRPLEFFNESPSGGYIARFADDQTKYPSHECYIDGVRCVADEAHFGGIVIEAAADLLD